MNRILITIVIALCSLGTAQAQRLALKSNLLMDVMAAPSLGVEMALGGRTTLGLNIVGSYKSYVCKATHIYFEPEFRYWLSGRTFNKYFVGVGAMYSNYDVHLSKKIFRGNAYAGGVTFGYDWDIHKHLNIEAHAGVALTYTEYHRYWEGDNYIATKPNSKSLAIIPFNVGVSLIYIIK